MMVFGVYGIALKVKMPCILSPILSNWQSLEARCVIKPSSIRVS